MDFRSLEYFHVVAEELNITRAAERLHMSQPPLSTQIRNLEEDLGVQLFVRGKRRLQLTEAGLLLQHRTAQILSLAEKTREDLAALENSLSGVLNIGVVEGQAPFLSARLICGFREKFPLVRYSLWDGDSDGLLELLARGLVDVALIASPYDEESLTGITVGAEPWSAIMSIDHPLAREPGNSVTLAQLVNQPLIVPSRKSRVDGIRRWFAEIGEEPYILVETGNYLDAVALAEQNAGISIYPQTTYAPNRLTVIKKITDPGRIMEYVLVVGKEQWQTSLVREFLNFASEFTASGSMWDARFHADPRELRLPARGKLL